MHTKAESQCGFYCWFRSLNQKKQIKGQTFATDCYTLPDNIVGNKLTCYQLFRLSYLSLFDVTVNWLDHNKTLREQSVDVNETLLLRRKYFFSDQNVDARDPVQLNLLYVQVSYLISHNITSIFFDLVI